MRPRFDDETGDDRRNPKRRPGSVRLPTFEDETGIIVTIWESKGFGFIRPTNPVLTGDVHFYASQLSGATFSDSLRGKRVGFSARTMLKRKGLCAFRVWMLEQAETPAKGLTTLQDIRKSGKGR